jgi:predicted nucleotidyltransferase
VSLDDVRAHREEIVRVGDPFGSVARGTSHQDSDLDLLIDVDPGHGYFDMAGFALEIEELLGVFTQVATVGGLKTRIRDRVLGEAVPV